MQTVSLVMNIDNEYVDKDNIFFKKLKKEELKNNKIYSINQEILIHHWINRKLESSIFEKRLSKINYFRMKKIHILKLIQYLNKNNINFHMESNFKVSEDMKEFLEEVKSLFKKNDIQNEMVKLSDLYDEYSFLFDNRNQYAFKIHKKIDNEYVFLTLNNLFVFHLDSRIITEEKILQEAVNLYQILFEEKISLIPIHFKSKEIKNHPYSNLYDKINTCEKMIEKGDMEQLMKYMSENKDDIELIKKIFKKYKDKKIEE